MNPRRIACALRELADAIDDEPPPPPAPKTLPLEASARAFENKEILTRSDAAALLNLHPKQIVRLIKSRGLPAMKIGRGWRFRRADVLQWLQKHEAH